MRPIVSLKQFFADESGVGTVLMLCLLPMFLALSGLAIMGASAFGTQTVLQAVADASALAGGANLPNGVSAAQQAAINYAKLNLPPSSNGNVLASSDFTAGTWNPATKTFTPGGNAPNAVSVVLRRSLSNSNALPAVFLGFIGITSIDVSARSVVTANSAKLRVSLVLDNTGSMCDDGQHGANYQNPCPSPYPHSKIAVLKTATTNLLNTLKGASAKSGDVTVAIVPFTTAVDVGATNYGASWLTWSDFDSQKPSTPSTSVGPGSTCPWTDASQGYHCQASPSSATTVTKVPSSGTYSGYICPSDTTNYPGCFNSVSAGNGKYNHTWISYHPDWSGCVMDRAQNYDVQNDLPTSTATDFPAAPASGNLSTNSRWDLTCPSQLIGQTDVLDSTGWTNLANTVSAMQAGGGTDQPIGLAWGWMLLTDNSPIIDPGPLPSGTQDVIILLSDGLNTMDRWSGDGHDQDSGTDARMAKVCANAKAANPNVLIYTVYVDVNNATGNSAVLASCASTPTSKYNFDLTSPDQIITAFNLIGNELTKLRVVQ